MRSAWKQSGQRIAAKKPSVTSYERRYIPKTLAPADPIEHQFKRVYNDLKSILGDQHAKVLPGTRTFPPLHEIHNEASFAYFLRERSINLILDILNVAIDRVTDLTNEEDSSRSADILQLPLARALVRIANPTVVHERTSNCAVDIDLNVPHVAEILKRNKDLRDKVGQLSNRLLTDQVKPTIDLEILYESRDSGNLHTGLVIETKSGLDISFEQVSKAFELWGKWLLSPDFLDSLDGDKIPLHQLLMLHAEDLTVEAKHVFSAIVQTYHSMLARYQALGFLTWGIASISLRIDWQHPTEPGRHVSSRLFKGDPWASSPPWQDAAHPPNIPYIVLCLLLLQIEQGPIGDLQIEGFLDDYYRGLETNDTESRGEGDQNDAQDPDFQPPKGTKPDVSGIATRSASSGQNKSQQCVETSDQPSPNNLAAGSTSTGYESLPGHFDFQDIYPSLLDKASDRQKQAVIEFYQPVAPNKCRLAEPDELIVAMAESIERKQKGEQPTDEYMDDLQTRPFIQGPVAAELNYRIALAQEREMFNMRSTRSLPRRQTSPSDDECDHARDSDHDAISRHAPMAGSTKSANTEQGQIRLEESRQHAGSGRQATRQAGKRKRDSDASDTSSGSSCPSLNSGKELTPESEGLLRTPSPPMDLHPVNKESDDKLQGAAKRLRCARYSVP